MDSKSCCCQRVCYFQLRICRVYFTIFIQNRLNGGYDLTRDQKTRLIKSHSDGRTGISTTGSFQISCNFDLSYFPFDNQICSVRIESSRYLIEMQRLHYGNLAFDGFVPNDQWEVGLGESREMNSTFSSGQTYSVVKFEITLARKVGYLPLDRQNNTIKLYRQRFMEQH